MQKTPLPADVLHALAAADRAPGWNNRDGCIRRFDLDGCALYVVPFRRWAWHTRERLAAQWQHQHRGSAA
ncbi:MAG: hypothetical protein J0H50_10660 [Xanthomonadales bacterium]|nr:hypothetical protein [Xanthomonadales bacterium]